MKHVTFMSRNDAASYTPTEPTVFISITEPGFPYAKLQATPDLRATLCLKFHDADRDGTVRIFDNAPTPSYFTDEMADTVIGFIDLWKDKIDTVCVHCEGGVSRSAGVAKWIADEYVLPCKDKFESYSLYNKHVYSTLRKASFRKLYGDDSYLVFNPTER